MDALANRGNVHVSSLRLIIAWLVVLFIIIFPVFLEDFGGLVYADQNIYLDHLAAVGMFIGVMTVWRISPFYNGSFGLRLLRRIRQASKRLYPVRHEAERKVAYSQKHV